MTSFRLRPRFEHSSPKAPSLIEDRIRKAARDNPEACDVTVVDGHIVLRINETERHYWSPQLNLNLESEPGGATLLKGLYGPNPGVWGMFTLSYGAIAVLFLFVAIIGFSKRSLGMDAPILWLLPVLAFLAIALYVASQLGQKLGAQQTYMLHHFLEEVLEERILVH